MRRPELAVFTRADASLLVALAVLRARKRRIVKCRTCHARALGPAHQCAPVAILISARIAPRVRGGRREVGHVPSYGAALPVRFVCGMSRALVCQARPWMCP